MSLAQYNLNTKTDYLHRKMFLDPAGPVTVQRFEEVKYQKLTNLKLKQGDSFGYRKRSLSPRTLMILKKQRTRSVISLLQIYYAKQHLIVCKVVGQVKFLRQCAQFQN